MLVPKLRFKREDGTEYPEWEEKELKKVAKILMGQSPSGSSVNTDKIGIPLVQGKADILGYGIIPDRYTSTPTKVSKPNDIIMTVRAPVGFVSKLGFAACIGRGVCAIRANEDEDYIYYVLQNKESEWKYIEQGSTFTAVNSDDVSALIVPVPCLEEQQKIADFLSTVDEVIAQSEKEVQNLEQQKKAAMQKIFSQEVRFKREDGTEYPEWEEKTLSDIATLINGRAYKSDEFQETGKYLILRVGNLFTNETLYYSDLELEEDKYIDEGDLIYAWSATFGARVYHGEKCIYHYHIWKVIPNNVDKVFLLYSLNNDVQYISSELNGGTMHHLTKADMEKRILPVPTDKEEQQKIADFLSAYDEAICYAKQELDKWKELKKGLLQQMFV